MKHVVALLLTFFALARVFGQGADDSTIIRQGPTRSWPAGPFGQVATNFGVMTTTIPLINIKGKGLTSLNLAAVHRSFSTGNDTLLMAMGKGWSHTGVNYLFQNNGMTRNVASRATDTWKTNINTGLWDRNPGTRDTLSQVTSGFLVTDYSTKVQYFYEHYFGSYIDLSRIVDPFGNTVYYSYVNNTRNLDRITDASGRFIKFNYTNPNNTSLVTNIHLEANGYYREWDMSFGVWDFGNGNVTPYYLNQILFPSDGTNPRPAINFNNDSSGRITQLQTFTTSGHQGNMWQFKYGPIYPVLNAGGAGLTGVVEIDQPSQANPAVLDTTHTTTLKYQTTWTGSGGGGPNDDLYCQITDPMGFVHTHEYSDWIVQPDGTGQSSNYFPLPIRYVIDPWVTRYLDPRNSQSTTQWQWYETYYWNPADATLNYFIDKEGHKTTYTYTTSGDYVNRGLVYSKSITNDDGTIFNDTFGYTTDGKMSQHIDPYGTVTTFAYDPTTRALTQKALDPSGANITTNFKYGPSGNSLGEVIEQWTGSDPHTIYNNFDTYGNARQVIPPTASATNFTFDDFNNKLSVTPPSPQGTTNYTYDWWNRQLRTTFPDSNYTENTYDYEGNVTNVRMEDGSNRSATFDGFNQPITSTIPVDANSLHNLVTTTHYDFNERKDYVVAPDGLRTTFQYNQRGDLVLTGYSDGTNRQWGYDGNENVLWRQNGRQNITYYTYDYLNRLKTINYQTATPNVSYTYRMDGLRATRSDVMGTSTWTYNTAKQLTDSHDAATNQNLHFTYDSSGRPTSTVAPGNTWSYYYDPATTRPSYTTQSISGEIARNSLFYSDGSVQRKTNAGPNLKTEFGYDTRGRTTSIRHAVTSIDQTQEQLGYQYTNGNVSQYTLAINGGASYTTNYLHDNANRLTSEIRTSSNGLNGFNNTYQYTAGDDRYSTTRNGTTSTYSYYAGTNRLYTGEGYTVSSYDADGNPTSIMVPNSGLWALSYDEESRLVQVIKPGRTTTFKYNGEGLRVERSTPDSTYRYLLNGDNIVLTTTTSYSIQAYYSPGVGYFSGGLMHYYQSNALGSAIVVRDSAGNFESLTEYDAYGGEYDIQGTGKSDFRFAGAHGYIKDDETNMQLLGERYYLPILGRFLNEDPIGIKGGLNRYQYCDNNPLIKLDPQGTQSVSTPPGKVTYYKTLYEMYKFEASAGGTGTSVMSFARWCAQNAKDTGTKLEWHHVFPQAFRGQFEEIFGDSKFIDKYLIQIPDFIHKTLHNEGANGGWYNRDWATFFAKYGDRLPAPRETIQFAQKMLEKSDLANRLSDLGPKIKN